MTSPTPITAASPDMTPVFKQCGYQVRQHHMDEAAEMIADRPAPMGGMSVRLFNSPEFQRAVAFMNAVGERK